MSTRLFIVVLLWNMSLHGQAPTLKPEKFNICSETMQVNDLPDPGDYSISYGLVGNGNTRRSTPSPKSLSGNAAASISMTRCMLVAISSQTFQVTKTPGQSNVVSAGVTKMEVNRNILHSEVPAPDKSRDRDFSLDYTITLPTGPSVPPGVESYAHQFLAEYSMNLSSPDYLEVDAGDYMAGRNMKPGYKHTGLITVVYVRNFKLNGSSPTSFTFELDGGTHSESDPSSLVSAEGIGHKFKSGIALRGAVITGLTANDPKIGFSISLQFSGKLRKGPAAISNAQLLRTNGSASKR